MRALSQQEMNQVSGGCFSLSWSSWGCKSYSHSCQPKPSCDPAPKCDPKPTCSPKPSCDPKPACPPVEIPL